MIAVTGRVDESSVRVLLEAPGLSAPAAFRFQLEKAASTGDDGVVTAWTVVDTVWHVVGNVPTVLKRGSLDSSSV